MFTERSFRELCLGTWYGLSYINAYSTGSSDIQIWVIRTEIQVDFVSMNGKMCGEIVDVWALGKTSVMSIMSGSSPAIHIQRSSRLLMNWSAFVYKTFSARCPLASHILCG